VYVVHDDALYKLTTFTFTFNQLEAHSPVSCNCVMMLRSSEMGLC